MGLKGRSDSPQKEVDVAVGAGGRREAFPLARGPARRWRRGWAGDTRDAVLAQPSPSAAPGPSPPPPKPWGSPEPQAPEAVPVQPRSS